MTDRKFLDIDMDNFDKRMAAIEPAVSMKVPNKLGAAESGEKLSVNLKFAKMDDFAARGHRPSGARDGQAARGARAALQSAALHGWQGRQPKTRSKKLLADPAVDGGDEAKLEREAVGRRIGGVRKNADGFAVVQQQIWRALRPSPKPTNSPRS